MFSSKNYADKTRNYGDCFLYIENGQAIVYDCGSIEHAERVIEMLNKYSIKKADVILSHNDSDHFDGIPYLIEQGYVNKLFTNLLLKYKDDILDEINDGRRNRESIGNAITEAYDNIASLSGTVELRDIYENSDELPEHVTFIGPSFEYMIAAVAKGLDGRQGDTIDTETVVNATSIQIQFSFSGKKLLLTGDCTADAISEDVDLSQYQFIQLPHHGKFVHANKIFDRVGNNFLNLFLVSDNTGNSNGGSDDLMNNRKGRRIKNTKIDGDYTIEETGVSKNMNGYIPSILAGGSLGI